MNWTVPRRRILIGIFLFSFLLRAFLAWHPPQHYFDEIYFSFTGQEIAKGNPDAWKVAGQAPKGFAFAWDHPPLGKELIGITIVLFGDHPFVWRLAPILAGALGSVMVFLVAELLFDSFIAGLLAAFLFTFDGFLFAMSRIGTTDMMLLLWVLGVLWGILLFRKSNQHLGFWVTAVSSGLAIATKWAGAPTLLLSALWVGLPIIMNAQTKLTERIGRVFLLLIGIPGAIYLATYLPHLIVNRSYTEIIELQKQAWWYHTRLKATHPYQTAWWQWPVMVRGIWFWVDYSKNAQKLIGNLYALGNPFIWWGALLAMFGTLYAALTRRTFTQLFLSVNFLVLWLFWSAAPRITFLYHYMPAFTISLLALVYWVHQFWNRPNMQKWVMGYLGLVLVAFILFYPIYTGILIPQGYFESLIWLPSWR